MIPLENLLVDLLASDLKGKEDLAEILKAAQELYRFRKGPRFLEIEARDRLLEAVSRAGK